MLLLLMLELLRWHDLIPLQDRRSVSASHFIHVIGLRSSYLFHDDTPRG